ncbi:hypothetical protein ACFFHJ_24480 [Planotetraspora thailandica]|nr:hypothetical protein [Planotetraspora thailandica]
MSKSRQRLIEAAAESLEPGEQPEIASIAMVGSMRLKRSLALGLATAALTGGAAAAFLVPVKRYVLLTDRRLLFFEMNQLTGRPTRNLIGEIPRPAIGVVNVSVGITGVLKVAVGAEQGLKLRFPIPARTDARRMAEALRDGADADVTAG